MKIYKTKKEAEERIKKINIIGAFSPVFISGKGWQIMSNVTNKII